MSRTGLVLLFGLALPAAAAAQFKPPTRPAPPQTSEAHMAAIKEGVALHNKGDYDGALARYQAVLAENADEILAWYETSVTQGAKKDLPKALEAAMRGAEYQSERIGEFYNMIGNLYVQMKQPEVALRAFEYGIALDPTEAQLYYNVAVSYSGAKRNADALKAAQMAAALRPAYTSAHFTVAALSSSGGYPVPALLAAGRYLTLDQQSQRAAASLSLFMSIMRDSQQQSLGKGPPSPVPSGRTEEGNFARIEEIIYAGRPQRTIEQVQATPEIRLLVDQMSAIIRALAEQAKAEATPSFAYRYYVPYYVQMYERNFVQPFVYFIFQRSGLPDVADWLKANPDAVKAFLAWSGNYQWPGVSVTGLP